jgi:nucleoside-diphosphate-sugar epimerase
MRWLVLGGTGLIGRYLVQQLLARGDTVGVVTRGVQSLPAGAAVIISDIAKPDWLAEAALRAADYDAVCHLAYATTGSDGFDRQVTVESVTTLLNFFSKTALRHFVYAGSMTVFGEKTPPGLLEETAPHLGESAYARNKIAAANAVLNAPVFFKVSVLHPTGVYDRHSKRLENYQAILKQGYIDAPLTGVNNIVHAKEVAAAIIACGERDRGERAEDYIINGEAIDYQEWVAALEWRIGVAEQARLPFWLSRYLRGPLASCARQLGLRRAIRVAPYKSALYQLKTIYSSQKAAVDFGFRPQIKFTEVIGDDRCAF